MRTEFPFELIEPIGEGGFATVYRGKFHQGEAAFKFIPIDTDGYKYGPISVGIYEYRQQEKINKINNLKYLCVFINLMKRPMHIMISQASLLTSHADTCSSKQ